MKEAVVNCKSGMMGEVNFGYIFKRGRHMKLDLCIWELNGVAEMAKNINVDMIQRRGE